MKEYIEREALNKVIDYEIEVCNSGIAKGALEFLKVRVEPAADVAEVRHGRWEERPVNVGTPTTDFFCSECNFVSFHWRYNYCPDCGAKMDKEE